MLGVPTTQSAMPAMKGMLGSSPTQGAAAQMSQAAQSPLAMNANQSVGNVPWDPNTGDLQGGANKIDPSTGQIIEVPGSTTPPQLAAQQNQQNYLGAYNQLQQQAAPIMSYLNTLNAPQNNYLQGMLQPGGYYSQIGQINNARTANDQGSLYDQYNNQMGTLQINQAGLQDQQNTAQRTAGYLTNQYTNAYNQYQSDLGYVGAQDQNAVDVANAANQYYNSSQQLDNDQLAQQNAYLNQQQGFAGDTQNLGLQTAAFNRDNSNRQNLSQSVASGAIGAGGTRDMYGQIAGQFGLDTTGVNNQFAQTQAGIANTRSSNYDQYVAAVNSRDQQRADSTATLNLAQARDKNAYSSLNTGQTAANNSYAENEAQVSDQEKDIKRQADLYGMDADSYKSALERGLKSLGLDAQYNAATLTHQMNGTKAQQSQLAQQIANEALQIASQNH